MAGIKQIYRSTDAFRLPTWDVTMSYGYNSIVAQWDSDAAKWRHFISIVQTTPGSLDSDIAKQEWVRFSFDSDILYKHALDAVNENFAFLAAAFDSDMAARLDSLDSELSVVGVTNDITIQPNQHRALITVDTSANPVTVTMPAAATLKEGWEISVAHIRGAVPMYTPNNINSITVTQVGTPQSFRGQTSFLIDSEWGGVDLVWIRNPEMFVVKPFQ